MSLRFAALQPAAGRNLSSQTLPSLAASLAKLARLRLGYSLPRLTALPFHGWQIVVSPGYRLAHLRTRKTKNLKWGKRFDRKLKQIHMK